jgi:hypothetical protein
VTFTNLHGPSIDTDATTLSDRHCDGKPPNDWKFVTPLLTVPPLHLAASQLIIPELPTCQDERDPINSLRLRKHSTQSKRWDSLIVGVICLILGSFIPYVWHVVDTAIATHHEASAQIQQLDQEVATRLSSFARSLKETDKPPSLFAQQRLFLNEPNLTDNTAWMYADLSHKSLSDLILKLITLESDNLKRQQLKQALASVINCEINFQNAMRDPDTLRAYTSSFTNYQDGTSEAFVRPVGMIPTTNGFLLGAGTTLISLQELHNLNLPRWDSPLDSCIYQ